jgi:hypothetical protein
MEALHCAQNYLRLDVLNRAVRSLAYAGLVARIAQHAIDNARLTQFGDKARTDLFDVDASGRQWITAVGVDFAWESARGLLSDCGSLYDPKYTNRVIAWYRRAGLDI